MKKYAVMMVSFVLVIFLLAETALAAALPGPPTSIVVPADLQSGWNLNGNSQDSFTGTDTSYTVSWSDFTSLPASALVGLAFEGNDQDSAVNFLGGQSYQFYWSGEFSGISTVFVAVADLPNRSLIDASVYRVVSDGVNTYAYVSKPSDNSVIISINGVDTTFSISRDDLSSARWYREDSYLYFSFGNATSSHRVRVATLSAPDSSQYGNWGPIDLLYSSLDSITFTFPNVSGSTAGMYEYTIPTSNFSWYAGQYKLNAVVNLPYGQDYETYFYVGFNFSDPASGSVTTITFTAEDISFGTLGEFDSSAGSLDEITQKMDDISQSMESMAQSMADLAKDSTVGQCLSVIRSIYNFLSGDLEPLLQQIEQNQDTLRAFLQSTMLPQIVTQLANLKASVDTGFDNTIAAIEAQTAALIAYLDSVFQSAGESMEDTNTKLEDSIGSFDEAEGALTDDFQAQWSSFDFNSYQASANIGNAFTWVSARFLDLWNAVGTDVQLLVTIPCVLGVGLMVITGSSRFFGRSFRSRDSSSDHE